VIDADGDSVAVRYAVDGSPGPSALEFRLPREFGGLVSDRTDAALVALVIPAMVARAPVEVRGRVSHRLVRALDRDFQALLRAFQPRLRHVPIFCEAPSAPEGRAEGVATGFSAGIDSFTTLAEYHYADPPAGWRLTHLLFNDVGSHGRATGRYRERLDRARRAVERIGLPLVAVRSNVAEFYAPEIHTYGPGWGLLAFEQSHTLRNAAVPFLLQGGVGRFLYASGSHYGILEVSGGEALDDFDPLVLGALSTDDLELVSAGFDLDRVEKTALVARLGDAHDFLDVCVVNTDRVHGNCGECFKCLRTLLTLEVLGCLDDFAAVFPLDRYRRRRDRQIVETLQSRDPLLRDLARHMRERDFPVPTRLRALAALRLHRVREAVGGAMRLPGRVRRRLLG
jgi:hypothetical protein